MTTMNLPAAFPFVLLLGATACGPSAPPKFSELQPILTRSCALSASCHQSAVPQYGNLKLTAGDAYCSLVGSAGGATFRQAAQASYPRRVVPGDRTRSFLYKKLILTADESGGAKPLGSRMPLGGQLDPAETDLFGRWIDDGAKDDNLAAVPCT